MVPYLYLLEKSEYIGEGLWRWSVFLPPESALQDIKEVVYTLHPTFDKPVRTVSVREGGFIVQDETSRPFTVYAKVVFTNGAEQLLEKLLDLAPRQNVVHSVVSQPPKPFIIAVDDDPDVLRAVERDLRSRYSAHFRVMAFDSGGLALEFLQSAGKTGREVAAIISDQRMPHLSGVEFLIEAAYFCPHARRALLTAYGDSAMLADAINSGINRYIKKPWEPPEVHLYPEVDGLLRQWWAMRSDVSTSDSLRTRVL